MTDTVVTGRPPLTDARERAQRVREQVHAVVAGPAATADPASDIYVGWVAAGDAMGCPARYRAAGAAGWGFPGWSPMLAATAAGRNALTHHLHTHHRSVHRPTPVPLPDPAGAVRAWMRDAARGSSRSPVAAWVADLLRAGDRAGAAATASYAGRWLGGFVRIMGWPLPDDLGIVSDDPDDPVGLHWRKKHHIRIGRRRITVAGSPDAVAGRLTAAGTHRLVIHRAVARSDGELVTRAGFEAVAAALTTGVAPAAVLFTTGDTGERLHVAVDPDLLERGVAAIDTVVRLRLEADPDAEAVPSPACRYCDNLDECPPGRAWVDAPGRLHAGLPRAPAPDTDGLTRTDAT